MNSDQDKKKKDYKSSIDTMIFNSEIDKQTISRPEQTDFSKAINLEQLYKLEERIAGGTQGIIHSATDLNLERNVAVKSLKKKDYLNSFVREARLTAKLDHPSIIPIYELTKDKDGKPSFSMKLINGITLEEYVDDVSKNLDKYKKNEKLFRMELRKRLDHFLKICEAISYAHEMDVVHRDLKPANIMLGKNKEVYVMDWGVAMLGDDDPTASVVCGTPGFMSPECINGKKADKRSDVFSLGMILYEIVTLRQGVPGITAQKVLKNTEKGNFNPVNPKQSKIKYSSDLAAIIDKARSIEPKDRYQSIKELDEDIRAFLANEEVKAKPDNSFEKIKRRIIRHPSKFMLIGVSALLFLAVLLIVALVERYYASVEHAEYEKLVLNQKSDISARAAWIDKDFLSVRNALNLFSQKVEKRLRSIRENQDLYILQNKFYTNSDFNNKPYPPEIVFSKFYGNNISLIHPVICFSNNLKPNQTMLKEARSISCMVDEFHNIFVSSDLSGGIRTRKEISGIIQNGGFPVKFAYMGLENGFFAVYPGEGGYPPDFDARKRPWYRFAIENPDKKWGKLYEDINGTGLMLPTYNVLKLNDKIIGVAVVDISIDAIKNKYLNSESLYCCLIDENGNVILENSAKKKKSPELSSELIRKIQVKKNGFISEKNDDFRKHFIFREIPSLKWILLEVKLIKN